MDMMNESIEDGRVQKIYEKLSAIDLENEVIVVDTGQLEGVLSRGVNCLVVKLLSRRPFNWIALKTTMKKVWRPTRSLRFHELGT